MRRLGHELLCCSRKKKLKFNFSVGWLAILLHIWEVVSILGTDLVIEIVRFLAVLIAHSVKTASFVIERVSLT